MEFEIQRSSITNQWPGVARAVDEAIDMVVGQMGLTPPLARFSVAYTVKRDADPRPGPEASGTEIRQWAGRNVSWCIRGYAGNFVVQVEPGKALPPDAAVPREILAREFRCAPIAAPVPDDMDLVRLLAESGMMGDPEPDMDEPGNGDSSIISGAEYMKRLGEQWGFASPGRPDTDDSPGPARRM